MQYSNFSRSDDGLAITFYNEYPIENVGVIKYYKDNALGSFSKKEFRWSFNDEYWSAWEKLTQSGMSAINTHENYNFFLQIRYTKTAEDSGTVTSFTLNYEKGTAINCIPCTTDGTTEIYPQDSSDIHVYDIKNTYNIIPVIDACTLNGYPGIWYRNRANQIGYQPISSITNLQHILNQLIASSGVTYAYVDGSLYARDISIAYLDSSLNQLFGLIGDTSIKGAVNVGDGSAGVYAGITSDGSIRLRELVGSGNLIVDQIGDLITIHLDASSSNFYSASNIPGGDASIFNQKTPFNDFQFKEIVSLDSSIISITSDSSFVYFEYVASPFDILDGGDSFANTETDIFDANSSVDVLVGGTY